MVRQTLRSRFCLSLLALALCFFAAGQALAWQVSAGFNNVQGSGGQPWAPYSGTLYGDIARSGGTRITQPFAHDVRWSQQAIDWMRANSGDVAITFHSSYAGETGPNDNCYNSWWAQSWSSTNMPGSRRELVSRNCGLTMTNEVRVFGAKGQLVKDTLYYAQAWYSDRSTDEERGQFNVDTYWVNWSGQGNYHAKYCTDDRSMTARNC